MTSILLHSVNAQAKTWQPDSDHEQIAIWPNRKIPNPISDIKPENIKTITDWPIAGKPWTAIYNVSHSTMTVYSPQDKSTGIAIVVFPGGRFNGLAIDLQGTEVCTKLTSKGVTCVLLKYRVPDSGPAWHDDCQCNIHPIAPTALQDANQKNNIPISTQCLAILGEIIERQLPRRISEQVLSDENHI